MKTVKISKEQAKEMHKSGIESLISIAESTYPDLFHKEKEWEDFGEIKGFFINSFGDVVFYSCSSEQDNINTYPTEEEAERELALIQLRQWRDKANGEPLNDWCDWNNDNQIKCCISPFQKTWSKQNLKYLREELAFKTEEIRDQFIKDHKTLIDKAFNI